MLAAGTTQVASMARLDAGLVNTVVKVDDSVVTE